MTYYQYIAQPYEKDNEKQQILTFKKFESD